MLWMVAIAALALTAIPYLGLAISGFPCQPKYVQVEVNCVTRLVDSRVGPDHQRYPNRKPGAATPQTLH